MARSTALSIDLSYLQLANGFYFHLSILCMNFSLFKFIFFLLFSYILGAFCSAQSKNEGVNVFELFVIIVNNEQVDAQVFVPSQKMRSLK